MKEEKKLENGCKIFTILFKNKESIYEFSNFAGNSENIVKEIAKLGETRNYYTSENLIELIDVIKNINDVIKNNFGLKLNLNN